MKIIFDGLPFIVGERKEVIAKILNLIKTNKNTSILLPCSLNDLAMKSKGFSGIYTNVDVCTTDSMMISRFFHIRYHNKIDRVYGPDLMRDLLNHKGLNNLKIAFISPNHNTSSILERKIKNKQKSRFLILNKSDSLKREEEILEKVIDIQPDILWIGIGSPKQIELASRLKPRLKSTSIFCVGAAFEFITKQKLQAPKWIQENGLEWLFRLLTEPKRLWRRYLIIIPRYILSSVLRQITKLLRLRSSI